MSQVRTFTTSAAPRGMLELVRDLLERSFEAGFSPEDWTHTLGGEHVVVYEDHTLLAHAAVVQRTLFVAEQPLRAGYVEGVATHPHFRGRGFGSRAMSELAKIIRSHFEMGALSTDRQLFYERLGWERWGGPTYVQDGSEWVRTPDEDEGVMVLRFGRSARVDLGASIACEARVGEAW